MHVEQISIFLENKSGRMAEVCQILADAGVNIRALSLADTSDFGVLRLIVDKSPEAGTALRKNGFTVRLSQVTAVKVADKPGGLLEILNVFNEAGINIEYMYAYANPAGGTAIMVFRLEPLDKATELLTEKGFTLLSIEDLSGL